MPEYIQRFHLDNHLVVKPQKSLWSKNYQYVPKDIITEEERETMNELKLEIKMLKEMMELMAMTFNQKIGILGKRN
ncbi:hypothetical protein [Sphingobacterium daejeonense]|uniref:hypothetical protein n=1 Tax=Sphingobacterium daejeonense TaxID=371142 RepID=UPI0010C29396|nr:hypothetical protein [Sphingobacterium daejeonense]VTP97673.1 Uncharacterised protein [Sphingobacterium daejeonense]